VLEGLLRAVKALFHLTAVAGRSEERHLGDAQACLHALQRQAASLWASNAVKHRPLLAFSHVCTAVYALTLQDCEAACTHATAADAVLAATNSEGAGAFQFLTKPPAPLMQDPFAQPCYAGAQHRPDSPTASKTSLM
jgi:hypothetical protein